MSGLEDTPRLQPVVLVANDQEWAARSLESILAGEGYTVVRAYNGRQALGAAATHRPDAIILDSQMPDLGGLDVAETLRRDPSFEKATPIFITTAGPSGRQERFAAYRAGAWEFFGHPLDPEAILLKLRLFLEARGAIDSLRQGGLVDPETGLYNRRGIERRGVELASEAARRQETVSCVVLTPETRADVPVDACADVGRRIGDLLRKTGRASDAIGRLGPLSFVVIAVGAGESLARQLTLRINELATRVEPAIDQPSPVPSLRAVHWSMSMGTDFAAHFDSVIHPAIAAAESSIAG